MIDVFVFLYLTVLLIVGLYLVRMLAIYSLEYVLWLLGGGNLFDSIREIVPLAWKVLKLLPDEIARQLNDFADKLERLSKG